MVRSDSPMARRAASKTQGRTPRQSKAPGPVATQTTEASRRGRKPKQREVQPTEPFFADLFLPGGVGPTSEASAETDNTEPTVTPAVEHSGPTAGSKLPGAA